MNQEEKQLYKTFEKEVWLYLDNELPEERQAFWDHKINEHQEFRNYLNDCLDIGNTYRSTININLNEDTYNLMIEKAIANNSFIEKLKVFFTGLISSEYEFIFGKIAFASFLIVAAIIISIVSNRPNPVEQLTNTINNQLLEWNPIYVDKKISKVENLLRLAKDDDYKRYTKYGLNPENVDKNINLIGNNIDELKKDINSKKL